ncbi:hypothetical protein Tco_1333521, partial [Tanacetum coccineum]
VSEARGAKDTLGILFWGVMHKRFGVITPWDNCYELKSCYFNVEHNARGLIIPLRPYLGVLQIGIRAKVIENQILSCLLHQWLPPHLSTLILSQGESSRELMRSCLMEVLHESSTPFPDYVPGPEHPPSPVEVPNVPKPEYPEYLVPFDAEAPLEDQPLPAKASPTALSLGYVADSDPDEDPEEDPEEDHADYPANGGDGEDEPSDDDDNDDTDDKDEEPFEDEDDDEEEEHLALADSSAVPVVDLVPSARDTETFETDESAPTPRSPQPKASIAEYDVVPTPPSPLSPWSSPLPQIPPPPLPPPPSSLHLPPPVPTSLPLPSSPLPPLLASLFIPPPVDRLCLTAPTSRYEVGESSTAAPRPTGGHRADYGFIGTMDAEIRHQRAEEDQDTQDIYAVIEDTEDRTHTQMQDYRIASQESLMTTFIAHVSSRQGQLSEALGQIQARDQTHADDPEGAGSFA